jgi:hypothetical protein
MRFIPKSAVTKLMEHTTLRAALTLALAHEHEHRSAIEARFTD